MMMMPHDKNIYVLQSFEQKRCQFFDFFFSGSFQMYLYVKTYIKIFHFFWQTFHIYKLQAPGALWSNGAQWIGTASARDLKFKGEKDGIL